MSEAQRYYAQPDRCHWHSIHAGWVDRAVVWSAPYRERRSIMAAVKTFVFSIKNSNKTISSNVLQNGTTQREAERKILEKHPGATILDVREK